MPHSCAYKLNFTACTLLIYDVHVDICIQQLCGYRWNVTHCLIYRCRYAIIQYRPYSDSVVSSCECTPVLTTIIMAVKLKAKTANNWMRDVDPRGLWMRMTTKGRRKEGDMCIVH